MTPEVLGGLIDRYGLPLILLGVLGFLVIRRILVLGSELNYVEARRVEEREGRLAAEAALRQITERSSQIIEAVAESTASILDRLDDIENPRAARR